MEFKPTEGLSEDVIAIQYTNRNGESLGAMLTNKSLLASST